MVFSSSNKLSLGGGIIGAINNSQARIKPILDTVVSTQVINQGIVSLRISYEYSVQHVRDKTLVAILTLTLIYYILLVSLLVLFQIFLRRKASFTYVANEMIDFKVLRTLFFNFKSFIYCIFSCMQALVPLQGSLVFKKLSTARTSK